MTLSDRKERVLQAIIDDYIATVAPVGSRTLARKYRLGVSPATVRNEMADLEEMGYLEQPHTSAGRIPSEKGYRLYVDRLMDLEQLAHEELREIERLYQQRVSEIERLVAATARLLAETTDYLAVVLAPRLSGVALRQLQVVPLGDTRALVIIVSEGGLVEHRALDIPEGYGLSDLALVGSVLNQRLQGRSLRDFGGSLLRELRHDLGRYRRVVERTLELLRDSLDADDEGQVFTGGAANILQQPEFSDVERAQSVLGALEQARLVRTLLALPIADNYTVAIGTEIGVLEMGDCSLVTSPYYAGDRPVGRLGVIGPKRMRYAHAIAVVRQVAACLSEALSRRL